MAFLSMGEIELITFFKPILQDEKLIKKGTRRNFTNSLEENVVLCCDYTGKVMSWTKNF